MDPLLPAVTPVTAPAVSTVAPVAAPWLSPGTLQPAVSVASPAAAVPTGWSPQPSIYSTDEGAAIFDAIANAVLAANAPAATTGSAALTPAPVPMIAPVSQAALAAGAVQAGQLSSGTPLPTVVAPPPAQVPAPAPAPAAAAAPAPTTATPPPTSAAVDPTSPAAGGVSVHAALHGYATATGRVLSTAAGTLGSGLSKAKKVGTQLWAGVTNPKLIHVTQVPSKYNPAPAAGNRDCGPTSVVMSLKLLGKAIPGMAASAAPQQLINRVRQLSGNTSNTAPTTNHELEQALSAAGTTTREISDAGSVKAAVFAGKPVILNGNPRHPGAYGRSFSADKMTPFDGAHWILVSGFDTRTNTFIVNDPLSRIGPVNVTPAQLEAYRGGSIGIEIAA